MKDIKSKIISADDLEDLLNNRFCPPEWAFIPQVRSGTGYIRNIRTADAIAMGLWPSRGLYLNGFEIKTSRGDWLTELKNPEKADEIAGYCDFWWIVAPKDIVKVEELPPLWGLMIPFGTTTKIIKQAELKKSFEPDKLFLAAILRRTQEVITPQAKINKNFKEGIARGEEIKEQKFEYERQEHIRLKKLVDDFEKVSGVHIDCWEKEKIGEAVKMVLNGEHLRVKDALKNLLIQSEAITKDIKEHLNIQK